MSTSRNKGIMGSARRPGWVDGSRMYTGGVGGNRLGSCHLVGSWGIVGESGDVARVYTVTFRAGDLGASRGGRRLDARLRKTCGSGLWRIGAEAIEYLNGLGKD